MSNAVRADRPGTMPYSGYYRRDIPAEDAEITHSGPGTPLGEYMRRFWQPVCMSEQLTDLPHAIRIMGEDLVAFRDKSERVGVLSRHCCHRGASLEYGIIQERGIRCCYHGFHFDVDGTILEIPTHYEGPEVGAKLKQSVSQGAYPALERDGLVFAYMGPPEEKPEFPVYDSYLSPADSRRVPFSNLYPCNWLQVIDNIPDEMHTAFLHSNMTVGGEEGTTLSEAFQQYPLMDYVPVRNRTAMVFVAGRRIGDDKVWVRINDIILPNITSHAYLFEKADKRKLFSRVNMTRWYVPVDDTHSIIYGWRYFGDTIDPDHGGDESKCGWDKVDFLEGQVGDRTYEEGQRAPGDWEALVSQRPIAIHALENPMPYDVGVYMNRKLLRDAIRGENPAASPEKMHEKANAGQVDHCYTQNTILEIAKRPDGDDAELIKTVNKRVLQITIEGDRYTGAEREAYIRDQLAEFESSAN